VLLIWEHLTLHYRGPDGVSLYERNKGIAKQKRRKKGIKVRPNDPEPEDDLSPPWHLRYLWDSFWTLNNSRRGSGGIPEESILAYQQNHRFEFKHWELEVIRRMDAKAQSFWAERRREERNSAQKKAERQRARTRRSRRR
jgi:hypothetical protein